MGKKDLMKESSVTPSIRQEESLRLRPRRSGWCLSHPAPTSPSPGTRTWTPPPGDRQRTPWRLVSRQPSRHLYCRSEAFLLFPRQALEPSSPVTRKLCGYFHLRLLRFLKGSTMTMTSIGVVVECGCCQATPQDPAQPHQIEKQRNGG